MSTAVEVLPPYPENLVSVVSLSVGDYFINQHDKTLNVITKAYSNRLNDFDITPPHVTATDVRSGTCRNFGQYLEVIPVSEVTITYGLS